MSTTLFNDLALLATRQVTLGVGTLLVAAAAHAQSDWVSGEVKKVDRAAAVLTLQHGEIASLDMPAMRSHFIASEPELLTGLDVDDRVRFIAGKKGGRLLVLKLRKN